MVNNLKKYEYYKTENGVLYCGDCLTIMPELEPVDLVLTDPPYGVRKDEEWDALDYFLLNMKKWLDICLLKSQATIWFCAEKMLSYILRDRELDFHRLLYWEKPAGSQYGGAMNTNIWYSVEPILVFGEVPKTDKNKRYGFSSFKNRTIPKKRFNHPTSKPEWLFYELAYFYSNDNSIILDPFLGSGTTAIACERLNRRWIGIEISEEYCEIAAQRITRKIQQLKMF